MKFDIKHILIFGLALGMTSCVETMKDGDMSTGFLGIPVLDADIQVEEFGATKATPAPTLPTLSVPESSALHFKVTDSKSNVVWNQKGLWRDPLKMPVGSYTIEVTYGPNTYGNPWYTGTCTGTISAVTEAEPATIRLSLCNSLLAVVLADDFAQHFTPSEGNCVTITSTSGSTSTTLGNYVFVPSGENLTIQVAGKSSTDVNKTLEWTLAPLSAATATYVTCSLTTTNAPEITMSSNADDYGAWGTVAYIPFASTKNINPENAANMEYLASSDGINFDIKGEIVEGVNVKFTELETGKKYSFCAKVGNIVSDIKELTVAPMPSIVVTATGTTSYDYYLASNLEKANNTVPETVSGIGYSVSGIDDKLKQDKFGYSETLEYDESTVQQNTTKEEQSWGTHTVSATVTFAGKTFNGYKECHITGLPYKAPLKHKFNDSRYPWTKISGDYTSINTESIDLSPTYAPAAKSPSFHIPGNIKIRINSDYTKNTTSRVDSYTYSVKVAENTNVITHTEKTKGQYTGLTGTGTLTSSAKYISCHYNYKALGNSVTVNSIAVLYE